MRYLLLVTFTLTALVSFAPQLTEPEAVSEPTHKSPGNCLAVKPIESHAVRNIVLLGVAGALISYEQYRIVDAVN